MYWLRQQDKSLVDMYAFVRIYVYKEQILENYTVAIKIMDW